MNNKFSLKNNLIHSMNSKKHKTFKNKPKMISNNFSNILKQYGPKNMNSQQFYNNLKTFASVLGKVIKINNKKISHTNKVNQTYNINNNTLFSNLTESKDIVQLISKIKLRLSKIKKSKSKSKSTLQTGGLFANLISGNTQIDDYDFILLFLSTFPFIGFISELMGICYAIWKGKYIFALNLFLSAFFWWLGMSNAKWTYVSGIANVQSNYNKNNTHNDEEVAEKKEASEKISK